MRLLAGVVKMRKFTHIAIWAFISIVAGTIGSWLFNVGFFLSSAIAAIALVVNGFVAEWEDRRRGR